MADRPIVIRAAISDLDPQSRLPAVAVARRPSTDQMPSGFRRPEAVADGLITASHVGLEFKRALPYEAWASLGAKLGERANSSRWWLGDWLAFGEQRYRRYQEALDITGLGHGTLRNYASVARRFELSRRRDSLSFQHHAAVCSLPDADQDQWLDLAIKNGWPVRELRTRLRRNSLQSSGQAGRVFQISITVADEVEAGWREASDRAGCPFNEWIIRTLSAAAKPSSG